MIRKILQNSTKIFLITIVFFGVVSCKKDNPQKTINTSAKKTEKLDITETPPVSENRAIPSKWKSLGAIQLNWIEVKQDEKGYLIYEPCDGETPTIKLNKGHFEIRGQIEPQEVLVINKFTRTKGNSSLMVDVYAGNDRETNSVTAEIKDPKNGLVLWTVGTEKFLMTPAENAIHFRRLKNNCLENKVPELQFKEQTYP